MAIFQLVSDTRIPYQPDIAERLLRDVWGFGQSQEVKRSKAAACFYYYQRLLNDERLLNDQNTTLHDSDATTSSDMANLLDYIKSRRTDTVQVILSSLQQNPPNWIQDRNDDATYDKIIQFAIQLWLFVKPDLTDKNKTLQEAVQKPLIEIKKASNAWLWLDFSAATLEKKAGFRIQSTSDISEHLTFESRSAIRVFSLACVLERYYSSDTIEKATYPPGLLKEVLKTLNLLWPMEKPETLRRVKRLDEKYIDIEANMGHHDKFDLRTYPVFGERLAKIQERLELEERRKGSSRGFKVAIWGIVLTAFFGLVSAATGTVSMWASLKQAGVVH